MFEFIGYLVLAILCIPILFIVVNMVMGAIWFPIGKGLDFLFRFPLGRLILAPIVFVSVGMVGMRLFPSLAFGAVCGLAGVYLLLWEKDD
ncbi:hypothetical protein L4D13_13780 [Photobacterium profundum]|uniref:hypothetical protein n=1 Tax=Photobacterium profundum TaxID=74109 RepID=UPI003D152340